MVSVTFQPYVGWREVGSRDEDSWLVCGLQQLREFVGYSVDEILLGVLVTFTTLYLLLIGEFVYSERSPGSGHAKTSSWTMRPTRKIPAHITHW